MGKTLFTETKKEQEFERMMQEVPKPPQRYRFLSCGRDFYFKGRDHQKLWKEFCDKFLTYRGEKP